MVGKVQKRQAVGSKALRAGGAGGVPRGSVVRGLKMPVGGQEEHIQKRLKNKSPWYQSILDPMHGADVKIPDATGFQTGTLQLVHRDTVTTSTDGIGGFRVVCPYPNRDTVSGQSFDYQHAAGTSTISAVVWPVVTALGCGQFETSLPLREYSDGVRIVSAAIYCQSEASLSQNSGVMTGYINPFPDTPFASLDPLSTYQNHYKSSIVPVNNNQPLIVRWMPIKQNGGMYDMFYQPTNPAASGSIANEVYVPWYEMGVLVSGAPEGANFLITVVINYEFLPFENAINIIDATPSPVDAQEVDLVETWVQDMDVSTIIPTKQVSRSPAPSEVPEPGQGTGFGMFAETVMEMLPSLLPLAVGLL